jgi:FtsH-like protein
MDSDRYLFSRRGAILYANLGNIPSAAKHVSYSEFLAAIQDDKVETVRVTNTELVGTLKNADKAKEPASLTTPRESYASCD